MVKIVTLPMSLTMLARFNWYDLFICMIIYSLIIMLSHRYLTWNSNLVIIKLQQVNKIKMEITWRCYFIISKISCKLIKSTSLLIFCFLFYLKIFSLNFQTNQEYFSTFQHQTIFRYNHTVTWNLLYISNSIVLKLPTIL